MYLFTVLDEGLFVEHDNGKGIARVETRTVKFSDHVDGDPAKPKLALGQNFVTPLPRDHWRVHFTSYKFTPAELMAFCRELSEQEG